MTGAAGSSANAVPGIAATAPVQIARAAGRYALLIERFDRQGGRRHHLVSALTVLGLTAYPEGRYATYVDLEELKSEGDRMVGDDIAEEGIKYLQEINFKDRIGQAISIAAE